MKIEITTFFLVLSFSSVFAKDSVVYHQFIKYPEVINIFYVKKMYGNNKVKEEGWVVRYKNAASSNIFRVKDAPPEQVFVFKIGVWKGYYKNGMISYTDTAYIDSSSTSNVVSYFNKKGILTEKYYNYSKKEVEYKNTAVSLFQAPYNNTMNSKDVGNVTIQVFYYENGKIKSKCSFCDTKPCGTDQFFDENGALIKEVKH